MQFKNIISKGTAKFSIWDLCAISLVFWIFIIIKNATEYMYAPVPLNLTDPVSLDPWRLPEYALRTTFRLAIGIFASIIFSIIYALIAAKVKRLQNIMISILDIMQSIPILGYISFTVAGFIAMFPGNILGFELAVIFAAFTCQVWNITYCIYQAIIGVPKSIQDTYRVFKLNPIQKFLLVEIPYSVPSLVWNIMISISNSWFFVVASEAIIEGNHSYYLRGIGSYIASAIDQENIDAIIYAVITMTVVIIIYNQLIFRPLIEWSEKFKYEFYNPNYSPSWVYKIFTKSRIFKVFTLPCRFLYVQLLKVKISNSNHISQEQSETNTIPTRTSKIINYIWKTIFGSIAIYAFYIIFESLHQDIRIEEFLHTLYLGFITTLRIIAVMIITIVFWLPISIYIGLRPNIAKFAQPIALLLASFPANLIFPFFVIVIKKYSLNPDIWLSVLLIISMQWYLVFNVLSGISSISEDLKEVTSCFHIKGWNFMRKIIFPAIMPHFMIGAMTAWGSAWNSTIIAEFVEWGNTTLEATGIGAYITIASNDGDSSRIILGIIVMLVYIEFFNRIFWRPLFKYSDTIERLK